MTGARTGTRRGTAFPAELTVRLTLPDGLIADIRELEPPPTIEVLYVDGCPHHEQFLPHLRQLLAGQGITAPVTLIRIEGDDQAQAHRFLGSPTVRINGRDVDPDAQSRTAYGLQCRLYATFGGSTGTPADQWILDALVPDPSHEAVVAAIHSGDLGTLRRMVVDDPGLARARLPRHGGRTLLHVATDWPGHYPNVAATIATLIAAGADPDSHSLGEHGETPLHWAASSGDLAAIDALLDHGADLDWIGYDELTPLDAARRSEAHDVIAWLEALGARTAAQLGHLHEEGSADGT